MGETRHLVSPDPPLRDSDLVLRPPRAEDADALLAVRSEADIRRWMLWEDDPVPDEKAIRKNIERAAQSWADGTWAVFVIEVAGEVVGGANVAFHEHEIAEVSYFLRRVARGRGYATRSVRLLARWAFGEQRIERLELRTEPENETSIRVAERAGFTREGIERASRERPDGTRFDSVVFSLLPDELD